MHPGTETVQVAGFRHHAFETCGSSEREAQDTGGDGITARMETLVSAKPSNVNRNAGQCPSRAGFVESVDVFPRFTLKKHGMIEFSCDAGETADDQMIQRDDPWRKRHWAGTEAVPEIEHAVGSFRRNSSLACSAPLLPVNRNPWNNEIREHRKERPDAARNRAPQGWALVHIHTRPSELPLADGTPLVPGLRTLVNQRQTLDGSRPLSRY